MMEFSRSAVCCNQFTDILEKQQLKGRFCDTIIIPDENDGFSLHSETNKLYAHICILAASSPVLHEEILKARHNVQNPSNGTVIICVQSVGCKVWKWVLQYMYRGKLKIEKDEPIENVTNFVNVLASLQMITKDDFKNIAELKLEKTSSEISVESLCVDVHWDEHARPFCVTNDVLCVDDIFDTNIAMDGTKKMCEVNHILSSQQPQVLLYQEASSQTAPCRCSCTSASNTSSEKIHENMSNREYPETVSEQTGMEEKNDKLWSSEESLEQDSELSVRFKRSTNSRTRKTIPKPVVCVHCNAQLKFSKDYGIQKCSRKIKNPVCDHCKVKRQRETILIAKPSSKHDDKQDNELNGKQPYKCSGCGTTLKKYKSFLRHQTSCMLQPLDVRMLLQQDVQGNDTNSEAITDHLTTDGIIDKGGHVIKKEIDFKMVEEDEMDQLSEENDLHHESDKGAVKEEANMLQIISELNDNRDSEEADSDDSNSTILTGFQNDFIQQDQSDQSETEPLDDSMIDLNDIVETENGLYMRRKQKKVKVSKAKRRKIGTISMEKKGRKQKMKSETVEKISLKKRMTYKKFNTYNICNLCGEKFENGTKEKLLKHKKTECKIGSQKGYVPGPRRVCPICFKQLSSTYKLNFHLKVVHLGEYPYECEICSQKFKYRNAHRDHMMTAHEVDLILCSCCNQQFNSVEKYSRHRTLGQINKGDKPQALFICEVCGETFTDRSNYRTHRLFHQSSDEWKHKCEICNKNFPQKVDRDRHYMIHTGEKPFLCDICSYSTNRKYNLKLHQRKHEADNSESLKNLESSNNPSKLVYSCKTCNAQFKLKTELKAHLNVHDSKTLHSVMRKKDKQGTEKKKVKKSRSQKKSTLIQASLNKGASVNNRRITTEDNISESNQISALQGASVEDNLTSTDYNPEENKRELYVEVKPDSYPNSVLSVPSSKAYNVLSMNESSKQASSSYHNTSSSTQQSQNIPPNTAISPYYTDRYPNPDRPSAINILPSGDGRDTDYSNTATDLYQSSLPYRGTGFVPLPTARGMENWNFSNKENTVTSIEEAFRIIGIPPLVPVSAVDLSTTSSNTFTQPNAPHLPINSQTTSHLTSMMSSAYSHSPQSYQGNH